MIYKTLKKVSDVCQLFDKDKFFATRTAHGVVFTNNGDGSFTINGTCDSDADADVPLFLPPTEYSITFDLYSIENHKYLLIPFPQSFSYSTLRFIFGTGAVPYYEISNTYEIYTATKTGTYPCYAVYRVGSGATINNVTVKPQLFDLTEMYGAGNEPTTVEQFRQDFPEELYDYKPYCFVKSYKTLLKVSDYCQLFIPDDTHTVAGVTITNNGDGSLTIDGTGTGSGTYTNFTTLGKNNMPYKISDKLFISAYVISGTCSLLFAGFSQSGNPSITLENPAEGTYYSGNISKQDKYESRDALGFFVGNNTFNNFRVKFNIINLTEMYGAGNEPTTVEEFREKFPNELYDYKPYSIITSYKKSFKVTNSILL